MNNYFLMMLTAIREREEIILYDNIFQTSEQEQHQVIDYLSQVYHQESLEYPHQIPLFDAHAGLWAANTLYVSAQLLLYRKNSNDGLSALLPHFIYYRKVDGKALGDYLSALLPHFIYPKTASAVLSADLSLRFLPDVITHLDRINPEDELIPILENLLYSWHYSGINYPLLVEKLDFTIEQSDRCLQQLYTNRIIEYQRKPLAETIAFSEIVGASLGDYRKSFWVNY